MQPDDEFETSPEAAEPRQRSRDADRHSAGQSRSDPGRLRLSRLPGMARSALGRHVLRSQLFEGTGGTVWLAGTESRAPSIAAFFCGDDVRGGSAGRVLQHRVPDRITAVVASGGLPILRLDEPPARLAAVMRRAITVPALVDIHTDLPVDKDELQSQLRTSTTREDLRRIRRAGFSYRITTDPAAIREFHARHYMPLLADRFPEDGTVRSLESMLRDLDRGGELVCADLDGTWVAGIYNTAELPAYSLRTLGIRDADNAVRQKRVTSALIVRSLERAVELGSKRATLGRSVPFLGKGPVWFKAKWGGVLTRGPLTRDLHMFADLRIPAVRRMLAASPIIHVEDGRLVASAWLEPGDEPLRATVRDAGRFPGITTRYVLGAAETITAAADELATNPQIVPVAVPLDAAQPPLWLGEVLARA